MTRGDIAIVRNDTTATGHEQNGDRPAVIVSNNLCNTHSPVIEIVYLTTKQKSKLPTHTPIFHDGRVSTALCEAVYSVDKSRIYCIVGHITTQEQDNINRALKISLDLGG